MISTAISHKPTARRCALSPMPAAEKCKGELHAHHVDTAENRIPPGVVLGVILGDIRFGDAVRGAGACGRSDHDWLWHVADGAARGQRQIIAARNEDLGGCRER